MPTKPGSMTPRARRPRCGSARCWRPARPAGPPPGSSSAAAGPTAPTQSPAATMRPSSTLVSVSSVSSRPDRVGGEAAARRQVRHAEARGPDRHARSGSIAPSANTHRILADLGHLGVRPSSTVTPSLRIRLRSTRRRADSLTVRAEYAAADQRHRPALLGKLGGGLDAGRARPDDGHRRAGVHLVHRRRAAAARAPIPHMG